MSFHLRVFRIVISYLSIHVIDLRPNLYLSYRLLFESLVEAPLT